MLALITPIMWLTPYPLTDVRREMELMKQQSDWERTIVRALTLTDSAPVGCRFCGIAEVTSRHALSREDCAACLLDSLKKPDHWRRTLTVVSVK